MSGYNKVVIMIRKIKPTENSTFDQSVENLAFRIITHTYNSVNVTRSSATKKAKYACLQSNKKAYFLFFYFFIYIYIRRLT